MLLDILSPSRVLNYKVSTIFLESAHLLLLHICGVPMEMVIDHVSLLNSFFHPGFKFVQDLISLQFYLCIEALKKFLENILGDFFEYFVIYCPLVLHSLSFVIVYTGFEDGHTLFREIGDA